MRLYDQIQIETDAHTDEISHPPYQQIYFFPLLNGDSSNYSYMYHNYVLLLAPRNMFSVLKYHFKLIA